jgi:hypothetical protein
MQYENYRYQVIVPLIAIILFWGLQAPLCAQNGDGVPAAGAVTIESNPPGALVYLKGEYQFMGRTPFFLPYALFGKYRIQANRQGYNSVISEHNFTGESGSIVMLKLSPKTPFRAFSRSLLFPGWGQFYSGRRFTGAFFVGATAATFINFAIRENHYKDAQISYETALALFKRGGSFEEEQEAYSRLQSALRKLDETQNDRNTSLYILSGLWVLNMLESFLFFPKDEQEIEIFQKLSPKFSQAGNHGIMLTMQFPID